MVKSRMNLKIPLHLAIIPDGNRRFGKKYHLPLAVAYAKGVEKLREVLNWSKELGIKILTVWGFSTENFNRSSYERKAFFSLLEKKAKEILNTGELQDQDIRVKFIGKIERFPKSLRRVLRTIERKTKHCEGMRVNVALGYGGRQEIVDACNKILRLGLKRVNQRTFAKYLYLNDVPDPDLVIRTSGEQRLSGFLPWHIAYSELVFLPCLWPELTKRDFLTAIREFSKRERRFGR